MTLIDRVTEGSQTVATKENCPPNPFLNPNPNRGRGGGAVFLAGQLSGHRYRTTK